MNLISFVHKATGKSRRLFAYF